MLPNSLVSHLVAKVVYVQFGGVRLRFTFVSVSVVNTLKCGELAFDAV